MAQTQVTHDGVSKEEKEQLIQDYLVSHGLYILDAPKVQHQEANIMQDDIRYPLRGSSQDTQSGEEDNECDYSDLTHLFDNEEDIPNYITTDASYSKINNNKEVLSLLYDRTPTPYTGLCLLAKQNRFISFTLLRPIEGIVDIDVYTNKLYSFLIYDGSTFSQVGGKIAYFVTKLTEEYKFNDIKILLDQSEPFNSQYCIISSNNIVDISEEYPHVFDVSLYGTDIRKIYTDWVEDYEKNGNKKKPVVYVPSGNIKETLPIPPVEFSSAFEPDMRKIKGVLSELYTVQLLDDSTIELQPYKEYDLWYWFVGANTFTGIIKDCVFYNIPTRYIKSIN